MRVETRVNGTLVAADIPPRLLLSDFLRHELRLTGTNVGCEMGVCGACTVMLDGEPIRSCLMFAVQTDGRVVRTIEDLAPDDILGALQTAFHEHHALQCGYCTPGVLMTLEALRLKGQLPRDEAGVRDALSGNICRCTGYQPMVDAVLALAR